MSDSDAEATLNGGHSREYLRRLPDFEDFEAEQRALTYALGHQDVHKALALLIGRSALSHARQLVVARAGELNGDLYCCSVRQRTRSASAIRSLPRCCFAR